MMATDLTKLNTAQLADVIRESAGTAGAAAARAELDRRSKPETTADVVNAALDEMERRELVRDLVDYAEGLRRELRDEAEAHLRRKEILGQPQDEVGSAWLLAAVQELQAQNFGLSEGEALRMLADGFMPWLRDLTPPEASEPLKEITDWTKLPGWDDIVAGQARVYSFGRPSSYKGVSTKAWADKTRNLYAEAAAEPDANKRNDLLRNHDDPALKQAQRIVNQCERAVKLLQSHASLWREVLEWRIRIRTEGSKAKMPAWFYRSCEDDAVAEAEYKRRMAERFATEPPPQPGMFARATGGRPDVVELRKLYSAYDPKTGATFVGTAEELEAIANPPEPPELIEGE